MKYSFVLPAYKARFFREAIDSILNQTYPDFELIIVNDASPENLDTIVESYDDERIRYYKNEKNLGGHDLVAQWNHSISYASGEYIILASDDDTYSLEYLERMNEMVEKYPQANVFRPRIKRVDETGKILLLDGFVNEYMSKVEYLYVWTSRWIGSGIPFYMFKREALMSIGGFVNYPLAWFSDDATIFKLADSGVVTYNKTLFAFRESGESISTFSNTKETLCAKYKSTRMFYDEHMEFIKNYVPATDEEAHLLFVIRKRFSKLVLKQKIRSQLQTSSLPVILGTMGYALKLGFSFGVLLKYCKFPIMTFCKRLFLFKKK